MTSKAGPSRKQPVATANSRKTPPGTATVTSVPKKTAKPAPKVEAAPEPVEEDDDEDESDSDSDSLSEAESIDSTVSIDSTDDSGRVENGRAYQTLRDGKYWAPSDKEQFEAMEACHYTYLAIERENDNPLCHAPIRTDAQHILDIGTGGGQWAIAMADWFKNAIVRGVDLYPPPSARVPPNCFLEVDDVLNKWTWRQQFDMIHMRHLLGAFNAEEWESLYKQCYRYLKPGGWIEQIEPELCLRADNAFLKDSNPLAAYGPLLTRCAERAGRKLDTAVNIRPMLEKAGFTEIQEKEYKVPLGSWRREKNLKMAGQINVAQWVLGVEGWAMWLLTKYGEPEPWEMKRAEDFAKAVRRGIMRAEREGGVHYYHYARRVWARKPIPKPVAKPAAKPSAKPTATAKPKAR